MGPAQCGCCLPLPQALRKTLGWWLIGVAPLVPAKALFFSGAGPTDAAATLAVAQKQAAASKPATPAQLAAVPPVAAAGAGQGAAPGGVPPLRPLRTEDAFIAAAGCLAGGWVGWQARRRSACSNRSHRRAITRGRMAAFGLGGTFAAAAIA
jgi:hypothetical protein